MFFKDLILVPYDGTPEAMKALNHALGIAESSDEILILMVVPYPGSDIFSNGSDNISKEGAVNLLNEVIKEKESTGIKITTEVRQGDIVEEIIQAGDKSRCKLIVIGYKGVTKIGKFMLGSISGEIAKRAKNPVLIVK
jgi:nucleotide-binding universal stress UspA family protein